MCRIGAFDLISSTDIDLISSTDIDLISSNDINLISSTNIDLISSTDDRFFSLTFSSHQIDIRPRFDQHLSLTGR